MRYVAHVTVDFEFDVPGDDPGAELRARNIETAAAASEVICAAARRIGESVLRFDNPVVQFTGEALDDVTAAE